MISEESAALYVYGFGSYLDTFGKERFYRYIYFSHGEGFERGRFAPYMSGNIIDVEYGQGYGDRITVTVTEFPSSRLRRLYRLAAAHLFATI